MAFASLARPRSRDSWILGSLAVAAAALLATQPTIAQDPAYHAFADGRTVLGIPNGWNVLTNLPFLLIGVVGLWRARGAPSSRWAWRTAFGGIALVGLGSAWYHSAPSAESLVWDRLPMTLGFMGVLTAVLEPRIGPRACRAMLAPAVMAGLASVAIWQGTGDLRAYVWIQFTPLLLIVALVARAPRASATRPLIAALLLYGAAKVLEAADASIYEATAGAIAGHALKHLAAAAACAALLHVARVSGGGQEAHRHQRADAPCRLVAPV